MRIARVAATVGAAVALCACGGPAKGELGAIAGGGSSSASPFGPQDAKPAHCGSITPADAPNFFKISGVRVALPAGNALSRDSTVVQPGNVPIARDGIGVADGTGVCAVYLPNPGVAIGGRLSIVVQAVRGSGGGVWLGWVDVAG